MRSRSFRSAAAPGSPASHHITGNGAKAAWIPAQAGEFARRVPPDSQGSLPNLAASTYLDDNAWEL
jgi:hypothetical protein